MLQQGFHQGVLQGGLLQLLNTGQELLQENMEDIDPKRNQSVLGRLLVPIVRGLHHLYHAGTWSETQKKHEVLVHRKTPQSVFVSKNQPCKGLYHWSKFGVLWIVALVFARLVFALAFAFWRLVVCSLPLRVGGGVHLHWCQGLEHTPHLLHRILIVVHGVHGAADTIEQRVGAGLDTRVLLLNVCGKESKDRSPEACPKDIYETMPHVCNPGDVDV